MHALKQPARLSRGITRAARQRVWRIAVTQGPSVVSFPSVQHRLATRGLNRPTPRVSTGVGRLFSVRFHRLVSGSGVVRLCMVGQEGARH